MPAESPAHTSRNNQGGPSDAEAWRPRHNPWLIALTVTLASFMEVLDTSIANVALPHIAGNLSAGQDEATWVLTSYLVSNAIVLPLSGWLSNIVGRKRFYMGCVAVFTASSFLCGLAPSLGMLVLFRIIQGLGGGGLQPSEQAILADTFPPAQRGMAFAIYGVAVVMAPAIGPTLGGYITDTLSWRWIFFINIPVGILSLILTSFMVEDPPALVERMKKMRGKIQIDYIGIGLLAVGLGFLQVVLDKGDRDDWFQSTFITVFATVSAICLVVAFFWEWNHKAPVVDLHLLRDRTFAISNVLMLVVGFVLLGSTVLMPLFVQTLLGYTAMEAGLVLTPGALLIIFILPAVGFMLSRIEARYLVGLGLVISALALFHLTGISLNIDYRSLVIARIYQAIGLAFLFVPINTAGFAFIPKDRNNNASAIINLSRNVGGSIGISVVTTMLSRRAQFHQERLVSHLTPYDGQYQSALRRAATALIAHGAGAADAAAQAPMVIYRTMQRQATAMAFIDDFWLVGVSVVVVVPLVFLMKKNRPGRAAMAH